MKRTTEQIEDLQIKLTELRPALHEQTEMAQRQQENIERNQLEALKNEKEAEDRQAEVAEEASRMEDIKQQAEAELGKARPALESAERAVNALSKEDITDLKATKNPNEYTVIALKCVLLYLGEKKPDWPLAQKKMADIKFLQYIKSYNKDSISPEILK